MAHAAHFLQRLERAQAEQCDLALALYRDTEALRFLLDRARVPDGGPDRVAISLDAADQGPYLVVSRRGEFITCLGEGMELHDTPLCSHAQIQAGLVALERERARQQAAEARRPKQTWREILQQLIRHADHVSREEMAALATVQPVLGMIALSGSYHLFHDMRSAQRVLLPLARLPQDTPLRQHDQEQLRDYHARGWAGAHLLALASLRGEAGLVFEPSGNPRGMSITYPVAVHGWLPWGLRAAWAAGKIGKRLLTDYKWRLDPGRPLPEQLDALFALLAMGLRHGKLLSEVLKLVRSRGMAWITKHFADAADAAEVGQALVELLDDPEAAATRALAEMRQMFVDYLVEQRLDLAATYPTPDTVPEALAVAGGVSVPGCYLLQKGALQHALKMLPLLTRAELEDLYLPGAIVQKVLTPWDVGFTRLLLQVYDVHTAARAAKEPVHAPAQPGRNDPCPCGSGKKHKKCCGA